MLKNYEMLLIWAKILLKLAENKANRSFFSEFFVIRLKLVHLKKNEVSDETSF